MLNRYQDDGILGSVFSDVEVREIEVLLVSECSSLTDTRDGLARIWQTFCKTHILGLSSSNAAVGVVDIF